MIIAADENIPYLRVAFSEFGEVRVFPGRAITRDVLDGCEALLVRSVTRVNEALLGGTGIRFVGSATAGVDHVDRAYLRRAGVRFGYAPGSNANSVAEYVAAALLYLADRKGFDLASKTMGIVGFGHVGRLVFEKAAALGMRCTVNDPPLARSTAEPLFRPLDEALARDVVTFHVPLTAQGPDPTHHLINGALLARMAEGAILLNTSRGGVCDTKALRAALDAGRLGACVLDVWENEPVIDTELLARVDIGTAHIAGYSFDGKVKGTAAVYEGLCGYLGQTPTWDPKTVMPAPAIGALTVDPADAGALHGAVSAVYDIMEDDRGLRRVATLRDEERGPYFDRLRREYPVRREFFNTRARFSSKAGVLAERFSGLGFQVEGA